MAPKTPRVPRLVRGIAEALDAGDLDSALKKSEAVLEQHPSHAFCKALRARALELSGNRAEALILCREVRVTRTVDPLILGHVRDVYLHARMHAEVTGVYDQALKDDPTNEDNTVSLFVALSKEVKLQRQQQIALQLYRRYLQPKYIHWAVSAILLQVVDVGPHRSLDLAETLLQRTPPNLTALKQQGTPVSETLAEYLLFLMHLTTLRQQCKHASALALLEDQKDGLPFECDAGTLRLFLQAEQDSQQAVETARARYLRCIDQWAAAREYIAVAFGSEGFMDSSHESGGGQNGEHTSPDDVEFKLKSAKVSSGKDSTTPDSSPRKQVRRTNKRSSAADRAADASGSDRKSAVANGGQADILDFVGRTAGAAERPQASSAGFQAHHASVLEESLTEEVGQALEIHGSETLVQPQRSRTPVYCPDTTRSGHAVKDAYQLIKHLQKSFGTAHHCRTPFLAELEMRALAFACSEMEAMRNATLNGDPVDHKLWTGNVPLSDINDFLELLAAYIDKHGHLGSCHVEVKPFLCLLDEQRCNTLLTKMAKWDKAGADIAPADGEPFLLDLQAAQKTLTCARIRMGLRDLDGAPYAVAAGVVSELVTQWVAYHRHLSSVRDSVATESATVFVEDASAVPAMSSVPSSATDFQRMVTGLDKIVSSTGLTTQPVASMASLSRAASANANTSFGGDLPAASVNSTVETPDSKTVGRSARRRSAKEQPDSHGLQEDPGASVDLDDFLCIAAAHLLDMDRAYCASMRQTQARPPPIRDRVYLMDTLVLLEAGAKQSQRCPRLRLMLAAVYGAAGAAVPLKKWYGSVRPALGQNEAFSHIVLDKMLALGRWEEVAEMCRDLQSFHESVEEMARAELGSVSQVSSGDALLRSREYMNMLSLVKNSSMSGRAVLEEVLMEVIDLRDSEAIFNSLAARLKALREVAEKPLSAWTTRKAQECSTFRGLQTLPRCSPFQALHLGVIGATYLSPARGSGLTPTTHWLSSFAPAKPMVPVSSTATMWPPARYQAVAEAGAAAQGTGNAAAAVKLHLPPLPSVELSGLETLLAPRRDSSPGVLRLRALVLLMVHEILRPRPTEAELSQLLQKFQDALAIEGLASNCDPGTVFRNVSTFGIFGDGFGGNFRNPQAGGMQSRPVSEAGRSRSPSRLGGSMVQSRLGSLATGMSRANSGHIGSSPHQRTSTAYSDSSPASSRPNTGGQHFDILESMSRFDNRIGSRPVSRATSPSTTPGGHGQATNRELEDAQLLEDTPAGGLGDPKLGLPPPWRPALITPDDLFWRCILLGCDAAHRTLQIFESLRAAAEDGEAGSRKDASVFAAHTLHKSKTRDLDVGQGVTRTQWKRPSVNLSSVVFEEDGHQVLAELMSPPIKVAWDALRRALQVLRLHVRECARVILSDPSPSGPVRLASTTRRRSHLSRSASNANDDDGTPEEVLTKGEPFRMGGHALQALSGFVSGPLVVLIAVVSFMAQQLCEPVGIARLSEAKKRVHNLATGAQIEGCQDALGDFVEELKLVLNELYTGLLGAQSEDFDHCVIGTSSALPKIQNLQGRSLAGVDVQATRDMVRVALVTSHRRQLAAMMLVLRGKIDFLKSLNTRPTRRW